MDNLKELSTQLNDTNKSHIAIEAIRNYFMAIDSNDSVEINNITIALDKIKHTNENGIHENEIHEDKIYNSGFNDGYQEGESEAINSEYFYDRLDEERTEGKEEVIDNMKYELDKEIGFAYNTADLLMSIMDGLIASHGPGEHYYKGKLTVIQNVLDYLYRKVL